MQKINFRIISITCICMVWMTSCTNKDTVSGPDDQTQGPQAKTLSGKIIAIDEEEISWEGLRFGLICFSYLEAMGEIQYEEGDAYCIMDIGQDSTFSFDLPAHIEENWVAFGNSPLFYSIAYNDTNGNNRFACNPDYEPYEYLWENGHIRRSFIYIKDTQYWDSRNIEVSLGWNYTDTTGTYSSDFDRQFLMGTYSL